MYLGRVGLRKLDAATDDVESNRRSIIDEAQVREPHPAYAVGTPGMQQSFSRLVVREMSQIAENALFQDIRIETAQQAMAIVVRFDDVKISPAHHLKHVWTYHLPINGLYTTKSSTL